jgi:streptomycin 6-kinase
VSVLTVPEVVRNKATAAGAAAWLDSLPSLVAAIEEEWSCTVGATFGDATEAFVAAAELADGTRAVLKIPVPRSFDAGGQEITFLRLADGSGCARLLRSDDARGAFLVERLGRSVHELGLPIGQRHEILCATASRLWRPAPDCGLPTGAEKGRAKIAFITEMWDALDRPCSARAVDVAIGCAERRIAAHDDERSLLLQGDVHEWNTLEVADESGADGSDADGSDAGGSDADGSDAGGSGAGGGFKLVDPDGVLAEAEYELGVLMREDPVELMTGDPADRARWLAWRCDLDATAIWEWGMAERVSTGLLLVQVGLQPVARQMLAAADRLAGHPGPLPPGPLPPGPSLSGRLG